ncbi:MAG: ribonuclease E/G [Hyphomicrobiales bacterium]
MANKMLIDASHPEETRVVVVRGNRVEEFDFESANRKQLRGNIYLAKVTRVEPSLQAAFVEYGGNRHGFLAFSEIHPDYYQIPVADREALLAEDMRANRDADFDDERPARSSRRGDRAKRASSHHVISEDAPESGFSEETAALEADAGGEDEHEISTAHTHDDEASEEEHYASSDDHADEVTETQDHHAASHEDHGNVEIASHHDDSTDEAESVSVGNEPVEVGSDEDHVVEQIGGSDAMEDIPERPRQARRHYKIQEVIKRRQILLVQVVKEERGNKGAALTTYLSLAGRYSVLMPNTGRGGGISRKITNAADRKRLKSIAQELEVPDGMGVILRTAGAARTKPEIKRDFEYLMRAWETVRETTLQSTAPTLVYEEGSLVKRSIRDLYNKDIDEVQVAGEDAYKDAKDFMRMLMPSHAKNVKPYRETTPIFAKFGVEPQLDAMFSSQVTLKSGGYIVINQTEALVAIDVNSGRSTREHNIEDTALRTNLEAADEVARQLRLRDLAGLIVIDFIDMEENRNNRAVERRLKDALKNDRARIQVGRISPFGLMEMSRQRIRTGVLEGSTVTCPHCAGAGMVRATPSVALHVLRHVEDMLLKSASHHITVRARADIALYLLNQKRMHVRSLEETFLVNITILVDETLTGTHPFHVERGDIVMPGDVQIMPRPNPSAPLIIEEVEDEIIEDEIDDETEEQDDREESDDERRGDQERGEGEQGEGGGRRRRRRRRRRGGGERNADGSPMPLNAPQPNFAGEPFSGTREITAEGDVIEETEVVAEGGEPNEGNRRRRGRRGGRRRDRRGRGEGETSMASSDENESSSASESVDATDSSYTAEPHREVVREERAPVFAQTTSYEPPVQVEEPQQHPEPITTEPVVIADPSKPKKGGWWAKAKASLGN